MHVYHSVFPPTKLNFLLNMLCFSFHLNIFGFPLRAFYDNHKNYFNIASYDI